MKKALSIVFALVILLSSCAIAASASGNDPERKFYLLSKHVDWERLEEKYLFTRTERADTEEYLLSNVVLEKGDSFRAYGTQDDLDKADYQKGYLVPDGMGWYYSVPEDGIYDVYFYPAGDGECPEFIDHDWNNGYWSGSFVVIGPKVEGELYKESFKKQFNFSDFDLNTPNGFKTIGEYKELYYHKDKNGRTDWALVYARAMWINPAEVFTVIGNRVFNYGDWYEPIIGGYCVYDVAKDAYSDAFLANDEKFPGFTRAFDSTVKKSKINDQGRLIGDIDLDDELTILDCTLIQRCDAKVRDWPEDDLIKPTGFMQAKPLTYYSDFDRDGERDVVDATRLQRYVTRIG